MSAPKLTAADLACIIDTFSRIGDWGNCGFGFTYESRNKVMNRCLDILTAIGVPTPEDGARPDEK